MRRVEEVLGSSDPILAACSQLISVISPAVDAICNDVEAPTITRRLIYRCIVRRTIENLNAIKQIASSESSFMATMPLRPLCEDLIFGSWLRTLPDEHADLFIQLSIMGDVFKGMDIQNRFIPKAYEKFAHWPEGAQDIPEPQRGFGNVVSGVDFKGERQSFKRALKDLADEMGWPNGRPPSVYDMAKACRLDEVYEFFYYAASKSVHSNMHNMVRMVWGTTGGLFRVSSSEFAPYHRSFGLIYGVWLIAEMFDHLIEPEFTQEYELIDKRPYGVWLAIVLGGIARRNAFPRLVTEVERRWSWPID